MFSIRTIYTVAAVGILGLTAPLVAAQSVDQRLTRLERLLSNSALLQMANQLDQLRDEVRALRGELEVQSHELRRLKRNQQQLYADIDSRLRSQGAVSGTAPATNVASTAPATAAAGTPATGGSSPSVDPVREQAAYQNAFGMLKDGHYEEAAAAFDGFLSSYPDGQLADSAQFWLGEAYYFTGRLDDAFGQYQRLRQRFPESRKVAQALLKMGYIHHEQGRAQEAELVLTELVTRFPDSSSAGLARKRLQRIRNE